MSAPTTPTAVDLAISFDPTGYTEIDGIQLNQLVTGAYPNNGIGFIVVTADVAGNPSVPNATTTTKWQNYMWLRVGATTITAYVWNPNGSYSATTLYWQTITTSAIAPGSIVGSMIAANTIPATAIISLTYGQLTGVPALAAGTTTALTTDGLFNTAFFNSNTFVWGDLTGSGATPGTPKLSNGTVSTAKLVSNGGVSSTLLSTGAADPAINIGVPTQAIIGLPSSLNYTPTSNIKAGDVLAVNSNASGVLNTATGWVAMRKAILTMPEVAAQSYNQAPVALGGSGGVYSLQRQKLVLGDVIYTSTGGTINTTTVLALATAITTANSTQYTDIGGSGTMAYTPLSASSTLIINVTVSGILEATTAGECTGCIGLFSGTVYLNGSTFGVYISTNGGSNAFTTTFSASLASVGTSALSFELYFAPGQAGTMSIQGLQGNLATVVITEIL